MATKEKRVGKAKVITDRDRELLRFVGQGGVASLNQIHHRHWTTAQERTAQERLQQLVSAGYLEKAYTDTRKSSEAIYGLTRKGAALFDKLEQHHLTIGLPTHNEMKQQLYAQDTRLVLERHLTERGGKLVGWHNERELRSLQRREQLAQGQSFNTRLQFEDIADAQVIIADASGQETVLDIEIDGEYFGKMLKEKIANYERMGRPTLWVSMGQSRGKRIEREVQEAHAGNINVMVIL